MYIGGPVWYPPNLHSHTPSEKKVKDPQSFKEEFMEILNSLTTKRQSIRDAMGFCMDRADKSQDISQLITNSIIDKSYTSSMAKMYLISDILYNSQLRIAHVASYRNCFETKLPQIFQKLGELHKSMTGRITSENFKDQVLKLLRIWEGWSIYPQTFFKSLHATFSGKNWEEAQKQIQLEEEKSLQEQQVIQETTSKPEHTQQAMEKEEEEEEEEEDIDGVPLYEFQKSSNY